MNTDCAFWIGATHQVCQDYALAGAQDGSAYAVLADGCSSSADTDIGARLLASAGRFLPAASAGLEEWMAYYQAATETAAECASRLALKPTCLDATLLTITAKRGAFAASCSGDGVVALGRRDGSLDVFVISYAANYPQYASYLLDDKRRRLWDVQPQNEKSIQRWKLAGEEITLIEAQESHSAVELFAGTADDTRFAAVLSDGVQSYTQTVQTETARGTFPVPAASVLAELLAFKSSRGQFVQRRAQAFRKECRTQDRQHADDVALAVVWLGD